MYLFILSQVFTFYTEKMIINLENDNLFAPGNFRFSGGYQMYCIIFCAYSTFTLFYYAFPTGSVIMHSQREAYMVWV